MIKLQRVAFDYRLPSGTFRALDGVNLRVDPGEFVAIVGASGSGKTTLMNVIGLMATPTSGTVEVDGAQAAALDADALASLRNRALGFIFQHFNLLPRLSVLENVLLPAQYAEGRAPPDGRSFEAHARALLAELGLEGQEDKPPALLSGGQKQRVAIARALLLEPAVLLADEPTGALDSENTARVLDILSRLNASGKTIVVITHDVRVAARAKRTVRIHDGKIVSDERNETLATDLGKARDDRSGPMEPADSPRHFLSIPGLVALKQAFASIGANPARATLTAFGLSIGVASIVIMLTLTGEARTAFKRFFDTKGAGSAYISSDGRTADRLGTGQWQGLRRDTELPALNRYFERYGRVDPSSRVSGCQIRSGFNSTSGDVRGVDSLTQITEAEMKLARGRWLTPAEVQGERGTGKAVLIGKNAAEALFPKGALGAATNPKYPLGEFLSVRGGCPLDMTLVVVGVLAEQDASFDDSLNGSVWVPTPTLRASGLSRLTRSLSVVPSAGVSPTWFAESIVNYLRVQTGDRYSFRSFVPEKMISRINIMLSILSALTIVVGGLCTVIGGIGVMNIMLVNIAERIREIGIRKAVGARSNRIRNQFIVESTLLCLAGGILGIASGLLAANAVMAVAAHYIPRYFEVHFVWNTGAVIFALASSVAAGFGFGLLPARRAAAMDVVEALRQE